MRRLLESNTKKPKQIYSSIEASEPPYYDPYDIHIHKWTIGIIKDPQNHKEPIYEFSKENERTYTQRMYCSVCHELNLEKMCNTNFNNYELIDSTMSNLKVIDNQMNASQRFVEKRSETQNLLDFLEPELKKVDIEVECIDEIKKELQLSEDILKIKESNIFFKTLKSEEFQYEEVHIGV